MIRYLARRLGHGLLIFVSMSLLMFILQQAAPGEFLSEVRLNSQISADTVKALRTQYGLDRPLHERYLRWMGSVLKGELGYSFAYNAPASTLLRPRVVNTLVLSVVRLRRPSVAAGLIVCFLWALLSRWLCRTCCWLCWPS
jgi:peptide/nickel transport system permease protein